MGIPHYRSSPQIAIVAAYAATCLIWGTTWLAIKGSLHGYAPITGVGFRFTLAALFLYAIGFAGGALRGRSARGLVPPLKLLIVLATFFFGINYVFVYIAETRLSSGLVAVLFGTLPFFMFGFGRSMLGERTTLRTALGALLALGGVAVISITGAVRGDVAFVAVAIASAAMAAFANVYLKRWSHTEPFVILPAAMLLSGVACSALGLAFERFDQAAALAPAAWLSLLYLSLLGSAIAFYLNHWLLQRIDSWVMGLSALIIPVIAVVVGILFGGEAFTVRDVLGATLVIGGVSLALARTRAA